MATSQGKRTSRGLYKLTTRFLVMLYLGLFIALPLGMVFYKAIQNGPGALWQALTESQALDAFKLTFMAAGAVTLFNIILGTLAAYCLVRFRFPGYKILDSMIDLPFSIPTSVTGLTLASILGPKSWIGSWLGNHGWNILYHPSSIYIAFMVVTLPFVIRSVEPLLRSIDLAEEEAAVTLGAGHLRIFLSVVLPAIRPGILSGAVVSFARCLGEFGVVVFVAGTQPFQTEVASTYIFSRIEQFDLQGASAASVVVLSISYLLLWMIRFLESPPERRNER
ncbi:MAG: sulfate ABC transporter permease subunit CysT [Chlamydiae bacterium]|nr:sulfate ABC transporter permease subunit CysT [Chlamydiota bacterium]MBI3276302.1 sulfate ABC transporter permease subunit CysT [Chlamydiota bacterium]